VKELQNEKAKPQLEETKRRNQAARQEMIKGDRREQI
jgi:hypothetical protein